VLPTRRFGIFISDRKSAPALTQTTFFPPLEPNATGMLDVGDRHRLYWEESGNPDGQPAIFLHGGPGSGCRPDQRRYFDPAHYRIVIFDQRGAGRSTPSAGIEANTLWHIVADMEVLREHLAIDRWLVFGGSWGSTLGLAYAETHPDHCSALVVRGIWLCREAELDWWLRGTRTFFPENWTSFAAFIAADERDDLLGAYHRRLIDADPAVHMSAAVMWKNYETNITGLVPPEQPLHGASPQTLAMSRIMAHYMINRCFLREGQLLTDVSAIRHLPGTIVQGRYDMVCPTQAADDLAAAWPEASYTVIAATGHSAEPPDYVAALVSATERFKDVNR
jgi:proline iminopeptidase